MQAAVRHHDEVLATLDHHFNTNASFPVKVNPQFSTLTTDASSPLKVEHVSRVSVRQMAFGTCRGRLMSCDQELCMQSQLSNHVVIRWYLSVHQICHVCMLW